MVATTNLEFPFTMEINPQAQDLVLKLLQPDPNQRIGFEEFFAHPWLSSDPNSTSLTSSPQDWVDESIPLRKSSITRLNQVLSLSSCILETKSFDHKFWIQSLLMKILS